MVITAVQNAKIGGAPTNVLTLPLPNATTGGNFLAACIGMGLGASVVSVTDTTAGYDAIIAGLGPLSWWKMNETSGTTTFDYGRFPNNGITEGTITQGLTGPISANPADTAYGFSSASVGDGLQGWGILGRSPMGSGIGNFTGEVELPVGQWMFGMKSFSVAGWINGTTQSTASGAFIFDNNGPTTSASVVTGLQGDSLLGESMLGGGQAQTSSSGFSLYLNTSGHLEFSVADAFGNTANVISPDTYTNAWHFVVGVIDRSTNTIYLYVDGGLVVLGSVSNVQAIANAGTNATIGNGVHGDVSQVFVTNYALSSMQILNAFVASSTPPMSNDWIQAAYSYNGTQSAEIWYARGVNAGQTAVTITISATTTLWAANISEWAGVWYVDPLDQWSQNQGNTAIPIEQPVNPRAAGDLFLAVAAAGSALTSGPINGYTTLQLTNNTFGAASLVASVDASQYTAWNTGTNEPWVTCQASFVAGVSGFNPQFQFPEVLVEISTEPNYLAPVQGLGIWTNMSQYVRAFNTNGPGKQHLLDRIEATTATITLNNRSGQFNRWNSTGTYYNAGQGLLPMNPVQIRAAWDGVTSPIFFGYLQAITPRIMDALNVDAELDAVDILGLMNLAYLAGNNYEQLLLSGG